MSGRRRPSASPVEVRFVPPSPRPIPSADRTRTELGELVAHQENFLKRGHVTSRSSLAREKAIRRLARQVLSPTEQKALRQRLGAATRIGAADVALRKRPAKPGARRTKST